MDSEFDLQGEDEPTDRKAREFATIQEMLFQSFLHLASPFYRRNGALGVLVMIGDYRLDVVALDRFPDLIPHRDIHDTALLRISCRHPFFARRDVMGLLASMPGIEGVREYNLPPGVTRHAAWTRVYDPHSITFGFEAALDVTDRCGLLSQLLGRNGVCHGFEA